MAQISIKDIARRADVSIATVSRVLNNKGNVKPATLERVREAMEFYRYEPNQNARALVGGATRTIGICYPNGPIGGYSSLFEDGYSLELMRGVTDLAGESGYSLYLINETASDHAEAGFMKYARQNRVDGLLFLHVNRTRKLYEGLEALRTMRFPFAYAGERLQDTDINVYAHYSEYVRDILLRLIRAGHRQILYAGPSADQRLKAIIKELKKQFPDLTMIFIDLLKLKDDSSLISRLQTVLDENRITACCTPIYSSTVRLLYALASMGIRIPGGLSMTGVVHSAEQLAATSSVSSCLVPAREMGRELARLLMERIEDPGSAPRQADFHPVFHDHGSVAVI